MLGLTEINLKQSRFYQEVFAEGEIQGEAKGEAKGKTEGKAETLKRMLTRRFGRLPKWAITRVDEAVEKQLDGWLDAIFDAATLEGVLGPRPPRRRAKSS
jgi:predicted transposase YdaD